MQIFVNMGTAKTIPLDVQEHFTIENLMAMVQDAEGIALTHHVLELAGERLIEGYTLADYNIQAETTLNLFDQRTVENWCTVQQAEQADSRNKRQRVEPPPFSRPILVEAAGFTSQRNVELMRAYSWSDSMGTNEWVCNCGALWRCIPTRGPPFVDGIVEVAVHTGGHYASPELMPLPFRCRLCHTQFM